MIRVFDVHGNELEATFPKRAKGLVKKGRAQWLGSVNHDDPDFVPDSIVLYDEEPADHVPRTADIQHQTEVQSMFNNEIINNGYIPENGTAGAAETDMQELIQKMTADTVSDACEIPADAEPADFQSLLTEILDMLDTIADKRLSDDPEIAAIETGHFKVLSENLSTVYQQTISAMEQSRKDAAQIAVHNRRQQLLEERIAGLEEDKTVRIKTLGKLFEDGLINADQMIGEINSTTRFYNEEINKLIALMQ